LQQSLGDRENPFTMEFLAITQAQGLNFLGE
jgi:hypothetical protein